MFRNIFIVIFSFLFFSQLNAAIYNYKGPRPSDGGYHRVYVACHMFKCRLHCNNYGGSKECTWGEGFNDCRGCLDFDDLFVEARGEEMYDYALDQIELGNFNGTYTNNIINSPSGTFYRTVEWEYTAGTDETEISITINEL